MNEQIKQLTVQALENSLFEPIDPTVTVGEGENKVTIPLVFAEKFAELIIKECINKIETHQIPVGNSAAGEMACEWTYAALKEIRDEIKEHFGVSE